MNVKTINNTLLLEPITNFEPVSVFTKGLNEKGEYFILKVSTEFGFDDLVDIFIGRCLSFLMPDDFSIEIHKPWAIDKQLSGFFDEKTYKLVIYI